MPIMDLPFVAQPVFYSCLALIVGLVLLFVPFRDWWLGVSLGGARTHGGRFDPDMIQILIYRLCAIAFIVFVEFLLCFVTLFRICMAYDDLDVLANSALEDIVALLLGFWSIVTIGTVTILATVGGHVLVAMAYLWEPEFASGNGSSELEFRTTYNEHDMERLPLLNGEQIQSTETGATEFDYLTFDWRSEDNTLIPSSPGSLRSNSSSTAFSSDSGSFLDAWLTVFRPSDWMPQWQIPPLRPRRRALHDDPTREDILHHIETGSGAQGEFSDADDEMDPVEGEDSMPVEAISDPQSEGSDADDEMDEEESETEPLLRRSRMRQQDGADVEVSPSN